MDTLIERCGGLDVHKDTVVACVRVPARGGGREQSIQTFGTTTAQLLALRDWLVAHGVTRVGMESTGVYWKPVYYVLEDAVECWLLNARHLHNVPGRKTDVADAAWICQLVEHGLVRPSFVPPKPIRELRNLTRYRKAQIEERTREAQRLDKVLQDAGIKLSSVASDVLGVSGRAMLAALVAGTTAPMVLAELAKGRLRDKIPLLEQALRGRVEAHQRFLIAQQLAHQAPAPFAAEAALLRTIPGVDRRTAEAVVAEIGVDMSRFRAAGRLASWAGWCPGNNESAGRHGSGKTRKGSKWLHTYLTEAAKAAARTKGTYLGAQYARLRGRRGSARATVAVGHSILVAAYHILDRHEPYRELGPDYFRRRHSREHQTRRLVRQIEALGYHIRLEEVA